MRRLLRGVLALVMLAGLCLLPVLASAEAARPKDYAPLFSKEQAAFEEGTIAYRLYLPPDYDERKSYPLVLFLHGIDRSGSDNESQLEDGMMRQYFAGDTAQRYPCIIAAPQVPLARIPALLALMSPRPLEEAREALQTRLTSQLAAQLTTQYSVDPDRVYVTGLSMGGIGTWDLVLHHPDQFAAAIPICGVGNPNGAQRMKEMNLRVFHGAADPIVPVSGSRDVVQALREAGSAVQYIEYPGEGHTCWDRAYSDPETFPWLFAQIRPGSAVDAAPLREKLEAARSALPSLAGQEREAMQAAIEYAAPLAEAQALTQHQLDKALALFPEPAAAAMTQESPAFPWLAAGGAALVCIAALVILLAWRRRRAVR